MPNPIKKPRTIINNQEKTLPADIHDELFQQLLTSPDPNLLLRRDAVLAFNKVAGQHCLVFGEADYVKVLVGLLNHYKTLGKQGEEKAQDLALKLCQVLNLKELYKVYEKVFIEYCKSLPDIGTLFEENEKETNPLLAFLARLSREQLRHEEGLNSYARKAVYGFFNQIATIIITDYFQRLRVIDNLQKNIQDLKRLSDIGSNLLSNLNKLENTINDLKEGKLVYSEAKKIIKWFEDNNSQFNASQKEALKNSINALKKITSSKEKPEKLAVADLVEKLESFKNCFISPLAIYSDSKKIINWFEGSGLDLKKEDATTLQQCSTAIGKILDSSNNNEKHDPTQLNKLQNILDILLKTLNQGYQPSMYAIPKLAEIGNTYNGLVAYSASQPADTLPPAIRVKCSVFANYLDQHFKQHPEDAKKYNTDPVTMPSNPNANPQNISYFTISKIVEELKLRFLGYMRDWEEASAKQRENPTDVLDGQILIEDFSKLSASEEFKSAVTVDRKRIKKLVGELDILAQQFTANIQQINSLQFSLMQNPQLAEKIMPELMSCNTKKMDQIKEFKEKFEKMDPKKLNMLFNTIVNLEFAFPKNKVGENKIFDFYGSPFIGFLSFQHFKNAKSWSKEKTNEFGDKIFENVNSVLAQPVSRYMADKILAPEKNPQTQAASSKTLQKSTSKNDSQPKFDRELAAILDAQTKAIYPAVEKLYLNWCQRPGDEELERLKSSIAKLTPEQKMEVRKVNQLLGDRGTEVLNLYLQEFKKTKASLVREDSRANLQKFISAGQRLISHLIATPTPENTKLLHELKDEFKKDEWLAILQKDGDNNFSPIICAVLLNRKSELRYIFKELSNKLNPKIDFLQKIKITKKADSRNVDPIKANESMSQYASLNVTAENGETFSLLAIATINNQTDVMEILLKRGALLATKNGNDKKTALELAAAYGNASAISTLLKSYHKRSDQAAKSASAMKNANAVTKDRILKLLEEDIKNARKSCYERLSNAVKMDPTKKDLTKKEIDEIVVKLLVDDLSHKVLVSDFRKLKVEIKEGESKIEKTEAQLEKAQAEYEKAQMAELEKAKLEKAQKAQLDEQKSESEKAASPTKPRTPLFRKDSGKKPKEVIVGKAGNPPKVSELIGQFSSIGANCHTILKEIVAGKRKMDNLTAVFKEENYSILVTFVKDQIAVQKNSDERTAQKENKILIDVLNEILKYLRIDPKNSKSTEKAEQQKIITKYNELVRNIATVYSRCDKFIKKLDHSFVNDVTNFLEKLERDYITLLQDIAAEKQKTDVLVEKLKENNHAILAIDSVLAKFVAEQIVERTDFAEAVPIYKSKVLIPLLNEILLYLRKEKPIEEKSTGKTEKQKTTKYDKLVRNIANVYDTCEKFVKKLDPIFAKDVEHATKKLGSESDSDSSESSFALSQ